MTNMDFDDHPPLHKVVAERIPYGSWIPAGIETLPDGWVNIRIWSYDETLGRDLYITETCPGVIHFESSVTETVQQLADPDGELYSQYGDPYDPAPVVIDTKPADPPHKYREFADPTWQKAWLGGGYLGTCSLGMVKAFLAQQGFADAVPRPDGHVDREED